MRLTAGSRLGPYEVLAPLGVGGMGEVYRARDTRLDRIVALKVLPSHVASDPLVRQRLEREARTISSLDHPHICALYDVGHQNGIDFLVMAETLGSLSKPANRSSESNPNPESSDSKRPSRSAWFPVSPQPGSQFF